MGRNNCSKRFILSYLVDRRKVALSSLSLPFSFFLSHRSSFIIAQRYIRGTCGILSFQCPLCARTREFIRRETASSQPLGILNPRVPLTHAGCGQLRLCACAHACVRDAGLSDSLVRGDVECNARQFAASAGKFRVDDVVSSRVFLGMLTLASSRYRHRHRAFS